MYTDHVASGTYKSAAKSQDYNVIRHLFFKRYILYDIHMNIALRRFLHNHGNIATEGSPKPGLCPTLISNDFNSSL